MAGNRRERMGRGSPRGRHGDGLDRRPVLSQDGRQPRRADGERGEAAVRCRKHHDGIDSRGGSAGRVSAGPIDSGSGGNAIQTIRRMLSGAGRRSCAGSTWRLPRSSTTEQGSQWFVGESGCACSPSTARSAGQHSNSGGTNPAASNRQWSVPGSHRASTSNHSHATRCLNAASLGGGGKGCNGNCFPRTCRCLSPGGGTGCECAGGRASG